MILDFVVDLKSLEVLIKIFICRIELNVLSMFRFSPYRTIYTKQKMLFSLPTVTNLPTTFLWIIFILSAIKVFLCCNAELSNMYWFILSPSQSFKNFKNVQLKLLLMEVQNFTLGCLSLQGQTFLIFLKSMLPVSRLVNDWEIFVSPSNSFA
jgi:hypothetical protein